MEPPDRDIAAQLTMMGILGARIPPVPISGRFRLELTLGTLVASLFLFAYLALIPLLIWAVYWLAAASRSPMGSTALMTVGCFLILSLLKPLVARPIPQAEAHLLEPQKEPLLFAFVRELAAAAGIPEPSQIAVDCNVNCSCVFTGGITGLFRRDFVLVIGLPLVADMRLDQMAGVLAHELGHAALTMAIRASRLIWSVNTWFSRVVSESDEFDERLRASREAGWLSRLASPLAQVIFQPGRTVLRLLMAGTSAASSIFLRRMEREADCYQLRVAGTEGFISAVLAVNLLAVAAQRALVELSRMKREGRLVDNYPGLIAVIRRRYSAGFVQHLFAGLEEAETGFFSAHPCDKDRMDLARAESVQGIVTAALPAAVLFADCEALCHEVTLEFYEQELGLSGESCELVPYA